MKLLHQILTLVCIMLMAHLGAQPFAVGHRSITFDDPSRMDIFGNPRSIDTEIYYPAATPGDNMPVENGSFPILVFGHGFVMSWDSYANFWNEFVPKGYIMVFPTTEGGILPSHSDFGLDLALLVDKMQQEGNDMASPFFGKVSGASAIMGHSMGGGSSVLAAENNNSIITIVNFAAAETNPSAIAAAGNVNVPTLVMAGGQDCVAPIGQHQQLIYDNLNIGCKYFVSIDSASHCQFANFNLACSTGETLACPATSYMTETAQHAQTFQYVGLWLDALLKFDNSAFMAFQTLANTGTGVSIQKFCVIATVSVDDEKWSGLKTYPNPGSNVLLIEGDSNRKGEMKVEILDEMGRSMGSETIRISGGSFKLSWDTSSLPQGMYVILYGSGSERGATKWMKH